MPTRYEVIMSKLKHVMSSMMQINNEVLEKDIPDKLDMNSNLEPKIELSYSQLVDDIGKSLDVSLTSFNGDEKGKSTQEKNEETMQGKNIPRMKDLQIKTRRLSQRMMNKKKARKLSLLEEIDTIPSGASLYALLSAEQMFGDKKLDPRSHVAKGNIRVPIKMKNSESNEFLNNNEPESDDGNVIDDDEPPEWLKKVTKELLEQRENEDIMEQDHGNISPKSALNNSGKDNSKHGKNSNSGGKSKKKGRRKTTIVIGAHFPPRKPIAEEEKIITRAKIKQMSRILVKKSSLYDKIGREPKSPRTAMKDFVNESNGGAQKDDNAVNNRNSRRKRSTSSSQNELKLLSGSWTKNLKDNVVTDAGKYLDDLHKEMEIKEKIMKSKERTRRDSIKPTTPAYVAALKARRPTQSPNKMRRKVSALGKSVPVSGSPRNRRIQLRKNKRHSTLMLRRATMKRRGTMNLNKLKSSGGNKRQNSDKIQKDSSKKSIKSNASHGKKKKILSVITS